MDPLGPKLLFDKLLFSNGNLPIPVNPSIQIVDDGLQISWEFLSQDHLYRNDRVMMLAYFPESKQAIFETSGAKRIQQSDLLVINPRLRADPMHVYIAFGSVDDSRVSNSIYLGSVNELS